MDGELRGDEAERLLNDVYKDETLRECWQRYHIIGDALRNNLPNTIQHDLASRVSKALEEEPTIFCPTRNRTVSKLLQSKTAVGYAVAASVAIFGFVTVGMIEKGLHGDDPRLADNRPIIQGMPQQQIAALPEIDLEQNNETVPSTEIEPKLRSYVINHENSTSSMSRRGLPPNVRVVTFKAGQ